MTLKKRISVITFNVWGRNRWEERKQSMDQFMKKFVPDLLCVQEGAHQTQRAIAQALPSHEKVEDGFQGWKDEGNIYWNTSIFNLVDYGHEDIAGVKPNRCFFWVRLHVRETNASILVGTAHFSWSGHQEEAETGLSPRVKQANKTVECLNRLAKPSEPILFMGDLNEPMHPRRILSNAGYVDCFTALGIPALPTRPARPIDNRPDEVNDWMFSNNQLKACGALIPYFYYNEVPPSDHWPVLAFYEL